MNREKRKSRGRDLSLLDAVIEHFGDVKDFDRLIRRSRRNLRSCLSAQTNEPRRISTKSEERGTIRRKSATCGAPFVRGDESRLVIREDGRRRANLGIWRAMSEGEG